MGGPFSSATTWSCQSQRQTHGRMTNRGGSKALGGGGRREGDVPSGWSEMEAESLFLCSVVLAGGPNRASLIIICARQEGGFLFWGAAAASLTGFNQLMLKDPKAAKVEVKDSTLSSWLVRQIQRNKNKGCEFGCSSFLSDFFILIFL